jgi:hypothetical protein
MSTMKGRGRWDDWDTDWHWPYRWMAIVAVSAFLWAIIFYVLLSTAGVI